MQHQTGFRSALTVMMDNLIDPLRQDVGGFSKAVQQQQDGLNRFVQQQALLQRGFVTQQAQTQQGLVGFFRNQHVGEERGQRRRTDVAFVEEQIAG